MQPGKILKMKTKPVQKLWYILYMSQPKQNKIFVLIHFVYVTTKRKTVKTLLLNRTEIKNKLLYATGNHITYLKLTGFLHSLLLKQKMLQFTISFHISCFLNNSIVVNYSVTHSFHLPYQLSQTFWYFLRIKLYSTQVSL